MKLLHVDLEVIGNLDEPTVDAAAAELQAIALHAAGNPGDAFAVLLATLGSFAEQTDEPIALLTSAIETLTSARSELQRKVDRIAEELAKLGAGEEPTAEWMRRVFAQIDAEAKS